MTSFSVRKIKELLLKVTATNIVQELKSLDRILLSTSVIFRLNTLPSFVRNAFIVPLILIFVAFMYSSIAVFLN
jgi:hypothetical protein